MNDAIENITIRKLQEEFMVLFFDILLVKPTYKITKFTDFETETDFQELTQTYLYHASQERENGNTDSHRAGRHGGVVQDLQSSSHQ